MRAAKTRPKRFDRLCVLGNGYAAHLTALALAPHLDDVMTVGPAAPQAEGPDDMAGSHAHSHIFLPRMEREFQAINPGLLEAMAGQGLRFQPGSYQLGPDAAFESRRLFATRWQFNQAIERFFRQEITAEHRTDMVRGMAVGDAGIERLQLASGDQIDITPATLVVDAMGARSPLMAPLAARCPDVIHQPGNIVYITQFFRLNKPAKAARLPDPLIECSYGFGNAYMTLYPAAHGWFSVSLAIHTDSKDLIKTLRDSTAFLTFCQENPRVKKWLDQARPMGKNRLYINPYNQWRVPVFEQGLAPQNYLAVGDALTSMLPTLGANCSFGATQVRIARDLVCEGADLAPASPNSPSPGSPSALHLGFARAVTTEQFAFFQEAQIQRVFPGDFQSYYSQPQNRLSKRIKRPLRRLMGRDRATIERQLMASSSLQLPETSER